jgi:ferrous iron transport protein B
MLAGVGLSSPLVALVGNPNCGKTALFNALTGSRQKTANYAGVTVERKEGAMVTPHGRKLRVLDLPGTYSLRPRSPDEQVAFDVVIGRMASIPAPDVIVCVVDATNLRLNLRLALELKSLGRPVIVAVNMMDIARRHGSELDLAVLGRELGLPVVPTIAVRRDGVEALVGALEDAIGELESGPARVGPRDWSAPEGLAVRAYHREVERILIAAARRKGTPTALTRRIDAILLHRVWGLVFLAVLFFVIFQAVFSWAKAPQDLLSSGVEALQGWLTTQMPDGVLRSLLVDGIVAGVGSVIVFIPQILILFLFILLLEDSGYMARAAFLLDRLMGAVGLHGRAFIPLLSSFACAVPGIMATRTIENPRDRLATILIAPLMTCSARLPVYALIIAAFIPARAVWGPIGLQGLVLFILYLAGIVSALLVAAVLKKTVFRGDRPPLVLELPTYKRPVLRNIALGLFERLKIFLKRAGTFILSAMVLVWFLSSYPGPPPDATRPAIEYSFAGIIGHFLGPLFAPIGFSWQMVVALIPGMAAREVAVAALGTVYAVGGSDGALGNTLAQAWSLPTALAFLAWYVYAPQCLSTIAVTRRETNSWKWPTVMVVYMFALAYLAAGVTYHLTTWVMAR